MVNFQETNYLELGLQMMISQHLKLWQASSHLLQTPKCPYRIKLQRDPSPLHVDRDHDCLHAVDFQILAYAPKDNAELEIAHTRLRVATRDFVNSEHRQM